MIEVRFINENKQATSNPVYQWDYGQQLYIYGLNSTDATIQVHFYDRSCDRAIVRLATYEVTDEVSKIEVYYKVQIPDSLLENSYFISAFIYMVNSDSGNTTHFITIPVIERKKPEGFISELDPSQTTLFEQALIDINNANDALIERTDEVSKYFNSELRKVKDYTQGNAEDIRDLNYKVETLENNLSDVTGATINKIKSKVNNVGFNKSSWENASGHEYLDYSIDTKGLYAITYQSEYDYKYYTIYLSIHNLNLNQATTGVFNSEKGFVNIGFTWNHTTQGITQDSNIVALHITSVYLITPYDVNIS